MSGVVTPLGGVPRPRMWDSPNHFTTEWAGWFNTVHKVAQATSSSGPTTARPTGAGLYVGQFFFDTTLGIPIWLKTPGSSPTWVNASGTPV